MKMEIERKFLVHTDRLPELAEFKLIEQAYLGFEPVTRVRVINNKKAFITVKGDGTLSRPEIECSIPVKDAISMMALSMSHICKIRYNYKVATTDAHTWEIDRFMGALSGLWLAEIELESEDQEIDLPDWIREEVTEKPEYSNSSLAVKGLHGITI
jgi:adenylate cyclase